ncbi:MAG: DinB family protein [Acidobacteriota bacterium]
MKYESVADIYSAHTKIRERFLDTVSKVTAAEAAAPPDGGKWSIDKLVEHVAIVEKAMLNICTKLVAEARAAGTPSDGSFEISSDFASKTSAIADISVEAPERVHPSGNVSIADSLATLTETTASINALKRDLSFFDGSDFTFPHPFFGNLTAAEWLVVRGGHEHRHTNQIEAILNAARSA